MEPVITIKAKFKCQSVESFEGGQQTVKFSAVTNSQGENADFSKYTPFGQLNMSITEGTKAHDHFKPGKEYYLDIVEVVPHNKEVFNSGQLSSKTPNEQP